MRGIYSLLHKRKQHPLQYAVIKEYNNVELENILDEAEADYMVRQILDREKGKRGQHGGHSR